MILVARVKHCPWLCLVGLMFAGCTSAAQSDEQRLRSELDIPEGAKLVKLTADPKFAGTFGREGLRIYAMFQFDSSTLESYRKGHRSDDWRPLPLPNELLGLPDGPTELAALTGPGDYLCDLAPWVAAVDPPWAPYRSNAIPARLARYRVVLLDSTMSQLHIVYKQYY